MIQSGLSALQGTLYIKPEKVTRVAYYPTRQEKVMLLNAEFSWFLDKDNVDGIAVMNQAQYTPTLPMKFKVLGDFIDGMGCTVSEYVETTMPHLTRVTIPTSPSVFQYYLCKKDIARLWFKWAIGEGDQPEYEGSYIPTWALELRESL